MHYALQRNNRQGSFREAWESQMKDASKGDATNDKRARIVATEGDYA